MEIILNTELARLVLDYLRDQNLTDVSKIFCKYSPYLTEEYKCIKKGLFPINIKKDSLLQICREYCLINVNVSKALESFPSNIQDAFAKKNLIGKISYLLTLASKNINLNETSHKVKSKRNKRHRSQIASDNSTSSIEATQVEDLPGYSPSVIKKRRLSTSYYFLQDVQSASSEDSLSDDDPLVPNNTSISASNNAAVTITNQQQSNLQQVNTNFRLQSVPNTAIQIPNQQHSILQQIDTNSTLESTIYTLSQTTEPPVIIDTPKPNSSISFNTNQINNTLQTPGPLNTNDQNGNSICSIFNTTNTGLSPFTGEQVFIDLSAGQAYPFFVTNDGLNCMFINRTDIDTNSVQPMFLTSGITTATNTAAVSEIQESNSKNKSVIIDKQIPQSLDSKIIKENSTPDNNANINQPITRSLSTPRRKSEHVRKLFFSPLSKIMEKSSTVTSRPIIESVQILPQLPTLPVTVPQIQQPPVETQSVAVENYCSNSNSTDLTGGEHSNLTVIQRVHIDTPRRKLNLRSCKRVLSRSNSEDGGDDGKKSIEKEKKINKKINSPIKKISPKRNLRKKKKPNRIIENNEKIVEEKQIDAMEEWRQMRLKTKSGNFDQHLREISAKTTTVGRFRHDSKRGKGKRRKLGESMIQNDDNKADDKKNNDNSPDDVSLKEINKKIDINKSEKDATDKQVIKSESKNLLNFKIKTPIKIHSPNKKHSRKHKTPFKKCILTKKNISEIEKDQEIIVKDDNKAKTCENLNTNPDKAHTIIHQQEQQVSLSNMVSSIITKEREKRTANIAHLLETPFKVDSLLFPITPKFIEPQNVETPATKLPQITTFSSLKHLDIKTPAFAITPGSGLTPSDKETPKSGCFSSVQTDYSSGGSYYRPDESEDLDKQLDRNLNAEMRKKRLLKNEDTTNRISIANTRKATPSKEPEQNEKITETSPEIIVSCPVVLEKVKSFSDDKPNIIPHYKFSDALPELSDESTTSSSSSSSSSASSTSSSSSSSRSTKSSTKSNKTFKSRKSVFSEINSSEDEDWEIQSEKIKDLDEENSQLVTIDGEVRFPVRSWITPKKTDDIVLTTTQKKLTTTTTTVSSKIISNSMMSIYDEKSKQKSELELKRQRMKEQLAEDFKNSNNKQQKKTPTSKKLLNSRIVKHEIMMEKSKNVKETVKEKSPENRRNQIEVLTALNLSARKKPVNEINDQLKTPQQHQNFNILPNLDDNATSDVFTNRMDDENSQHSSAESLKIRNAALALTTLSMQQQKKLTLPIEPLPMKQMRGRPKKNIQINAKTDNRNPIKEKLSKKQPLKKLTIKLRRESCISPNLLPIKKKLDKKKSNELTEEEDAIKKTKFKEIFEPQPSTSKCSSYVPPIQSSEIRSSVEVIELAEKLKSSTSKLDDENVQISSATDIQKDLNRHEKNEENIDPINSADDSEEEDPYDACKLMTSDNFQIKTFKYSGPTDYCPEPTKNQYNLKHITNINVDGVLHKLQCTEEILLFSKGNVENKNIKAVDTKKDNKKIKTVPKKRERNLKIVAEKLPDILSQEFQRPQSTSTPHLPKIKISYKNKNNLPGTSKECRNLEGKTKTGKILTSNVVSSCVSTANVVTTKAPGEISTTIGAQENIGNNIRAEDISAVLSHLHGYEEP